FLLPLDGEGRIGVTGAAICPSFAHQLLRAKSENQRAIPSTFLVRPVRAIKKDHPNMPGGNENSAALLGPLLIPIHLIGLAQDKRDASLERNLVFAHLGDRPGRRLAIDMQLALPL